MIRKVNTWMWQRRDDTKHVSIWWITGHQNTNNSLRYKNCHVSYVISSVQVGGASGNGPRACVFCGWDQHTWSWTMCSNISVRLDWCRFTYEIAPVFVLMEQLTLKKMREIIGWPDGEGDGIFSPGNRSPETCIQNSRVIASEYVGRWWECFHCSFPQEVPSPTCIAWWLPDTSSSPRWRPKAWQLHPDWCSSLQSMWVEPPSPRTGASGTAGCFLHVRWWKRSLPEPLFHQESQCSSGVWNRQPDPPENRWEVCIASSAGTSSMTLSKWWCLIHLLNVMFSIYN